MGDIILLVDTSIQSELFNVVKAIVKKNKDERFNFDILPHIKSMYKKDKLGKIFRQKLIYNDKKLVACFFDPLELEFSLPLILEIMEFFDKVILVCQKQENIFFDAQKLSLMLGVDVLECDVNSQGVNNVIDTLKSNASSLFYKSQSFINYGYDFTNAVGFIDYIIRYKFKIENSNWLSVRLLEGDRVFLKEYCENLKSAVLEDKEILRQIGTAKKYLNNIEDGFDICTHIDNVKNSIIDTMINCVVQEDRNDFCFLTRENLLTGIFWIFIVAFGLFGWYFLLNLT